jgi:hypothetical protein
MKIKGPKILLAFALGFLLTSIVGRKVLHVSAQGDGQGGILHVCVDKDGVLTMVAPTATCANGQRSLLLKKSDSTVDLDQAKEKHQAQDTSIDQTILDDLNRRLSKLENMECGAIGKNKVVAPFQVFDHNGKRVFLVDGNAAALFNGSGQAVAKMIADRAGGLFTAEGGSTKVFFGINDPELAGVGVSENGQRRIALGKNLHSEIYSLRFFSGSDRPIAGIGVSPDNNAGLALISDNSGSIKAKIGLTTDGMGLVEILGGKSIAQLTEGVTNHGGRLWIGNAGGVGMVEAGDAGGYGIVKAGPMGFEFIPTPGLALPGSVIVGRR